MAGALFAALAVKPQFAILVPLVLLATGQWRALVAAAATAAGSAGLAWAMFGAAAMFIPLALAVPAAGLGLGWLWGAIWVLMIVRGISMYARFRSDAWVVTGDR